MPQFDVSTPERLCNACVKTQSVIFDLHAKLTTTRNGLEAHQARYARLMQCAQTLQVGAMFNCFLDGSMRPRKLALSDDLLMIALINTKTNKVTNAYEVLAISVSAGAHDDAKEAIGNSQLCFTMACSDHIFTLQALNPDLYQYWMDGIHLAQEMVMHKERVAEFERQIAETGAKLHEAIQSQINYAFPKVFPESVEPSSALTLIEENDADSIYDENGRRKDGMDSDSDDERAGSGLKKSASALAAANNNANGANGSNKNASAEGGADGNSSNLVIASTMESAPPAALKMGRSVPRQPGYMSPTYIEGARSPVRSPVNSLSPVASQPSSPRPVSPALSPLTDEPTPPSSPEHIPANSQSRLSKTLNEGLQSADKAENSAASISEATRSPATDVTPSSASSHPQNIAQSPMFEVEHLGTSVSRNTGDMTNANNEDDGISNNMNDSVSQRSSAAQLDSVTDASASSTPTNDSPATNGGISTHAASKPIASRKLDFGAHVTPSSSLNSYSPPISDLATTTPKRIEAIPASLDARAIVSGIAATNLSSSQMSSTFDSLPSTPQTSEKMEMGPAHSPSQVETIPIGVESTQKNDDEPTPQNTTSNDAVEPESERQAQQ